MLDWSFWPASGPSSRRVSELIMLKIRYQWVPPHPYLLSDCLLTSQSEPSNLWHLWPEEESQEYGRPFPEQGHLVEQIQGIDHGSELIKYESQPCGKTLSYQEGRVDFAFCRACRCLLGSFPWSACLSARVSTRVSLLCPLHLLTGQFRHMRQKGTSCPNNIRIFCSVRCISPLRRHNDMAGTPWNCAIWCTRAQRRVTPSRLLGIVHVFGERIEVQCTWTPDSCHVLEIVKTH